MTCSPLRNSKARVRLLPPTRNVLTAISMSSCARSGAAQSNSTWASWASTPSLSQLEYGTPQSAKQPSMCLEEGCEWGLAGVRRGWGCDWRDYVLGRVARGRACGEHDWISRGAGRRVSRGRSVSLGRRGGGVGGRGTGHCQPDGSTARGPGTHRPQPPTQPAATTERPAGRPAPPPPPVAATGEQLIDLDAQTLSRRYSWRHERRSSLGNWSRPWEWCSSSRGALRVRATMP